MTARDVTVVDERDVLAYVRGRRREHDRRRLSDRLLNIYMGLFAAAYVVTGIAGLIDLDLSPRPSDFRETVVWLAPVLLVVTWGVLRFATWQGPVLFSAPELQWVVAAPLDRRALVLMRLRRALVIAGVVGAGGGVLAAVVADLMIGEGLVAVFAAAAATFAALALMATALSWHVERSARWSRMVDRVAPLLLVAVAALAFGAATGSDTPLWWSGPWGWAAGPVVAAAGWQVPGWVIQVVLLAAAAVGAVLSAVVTADRFAEEELWRRAQARSSAAAALFFGDLRTIKNVARRDRTRGRLSGRTSRLVHVPYPWLVVASRDLLALRRNLRTLGTAAIFTAIAFAAAVGAADRPILGVAAIIGFYAAATRLLEPVRLEADRPDAHRMLPWPWGTVLVLHCLVPTVVLTALGWGGLAVVGAAGFAPMAAVWPFAVVAPFAAAAIVTPATISSARKPFPVESLIGGAEGGSAMLLLWMVTGPVLAAIVLDIAFGMLRDDLAGGLTGATSGAAGFLVIATSGFVGWLWTRQPPE